ncbi:MAG: trypsin-like peptidase domain-containing protein [Dehalococcoidales bacterium]|nr:trypsin-like peptidase domain-containing protein [Dehalococcoidales bacterium]
MKRILISALTFILVLGLTLNIGCNLLPASPTTSTPTSSPTPIGSTWTIPPSSNQSPALPSIADVVAKVKPSVVAINTELVATDIFGRPFKQQAAGSGWIIDKGGIIVTNNHVVEGATSVTVTLDDGRTFTADVNTIATDSLADLAVLKIKAENLPAATVGDSSRLRVGDWVVAIGNSLGQGIRASVGIVSQQSVSLDISQGQTLYGLIETDAAINPGNSGGPLVDMAGEVIGITSVKIAEVGVEGVGYAISTNEAMPIVEQLINAGYVIRPWLGVGLDSVNQYTILIYGLSIDKGALVVSVASGSPADLAGLKAGDVITRFAGKDIAEMKELTRAIHQGQLGQKTEIVYWRVQNQSTASATLIESPAPR